MGGTLGTRGKPVFRQLIFKYEGYPHEIDQCGTFVFLCFSWSAAFCSLVVHNVFDDNHL
jgi:hypothetical protein